MSTEAKINRHYIKGLSFPEFPRDNIEAALDLQPKDDDIIISTYPKTGTTWLQFIVYALYNNGEIPTSMNDKENLPYMEASGTDFIDQLKSPRILKYHVPYHLVPKNSKTKYINIIRDPHDVVVSYYHFLRQLTDVGLVFDDFFDAFIAGSCIYGDYFENMLSWYERRHDENVLLLSYEKMKKDPRKGLLLISNFLGFDLAEKGELIEKILKNTSFDHMKKNVESLTKDGGHNQNPDRQGTGKPIEFFRSGTSGQGKLQLTDLQKKLIQDKIEQKLSGTDIPLMWK